MDDDDLMKLLIRGWALFCANQSLPGAETPFILRRAKKFEEFLEETLPEGDNVRS